MNRVYFRRILPAISMSLLSVLVILSVITIASDEKKTQEVQASAIQNENDPISDYRTERAQLRMLQKNQLNDIIHDSQTDDEILELAQHQILEILNNETHESILEGILQMRGFENAVVTINAGTANILIKKELITQQETAIILELAMRETGIEAGNIKIIPIK